MMVDKNYSQDFPKTIGVLEAIKIARADTSIISLISQDPKTEIYHHFLGKPEIDALNSEFPDLLPTKADSVFSINVISSQITNQQGYKKVRIYIDTEGKIINRFEN